MLRGCVVDCTLGAACHPSTITPCPPPPTTTPGLARLQLKKLYADSREDMAASTFVPATSFNCDSREPERWSFYLRRLRWSLSA